MLFKCLELKVVELRFSFRFVFFKGSDYFVTDEFFEGEKFLVGDFNLFRYKYV